jgi:hypothetical protein
MGEGGILRAMHTRGTTFISNAGKTRKCGRCGAIAGYCATRGR